MKQIKTFITNWPGDNDKEINKFLAQVKNPKITTMINKGYYVVTVEYEVINDNLTTIENENLNHYANVYDHFIYN
jgi:hypothetical protein